MTITLLPENTSGGHAHGATDPRRPKGTIFQLDEDVNIKRRVRDSLSVNLSDSTFTFLYRTSGVSGRETIAVLASDGGTTAGDSGTITIRHPGLMPVSRDGDRHYFSDQNGIGGQRNGNNNNWLKPAVADSLLELFRRYFEAVPQNRFNSGETRFRVTEASLPWGGLLDAHPDSAWTIPHKLHRTGSDIDINQGYIGDREQFYQLCREIRTFSCDPHANQRNPDPGNPAHYHVHIMARS